MNSQSSVINPGGDYEETIERLAKHLGRDKNRRAVFGLLYGRGSKPRSKKQMAEALDIGGTAQVVQNALDELARHNLIVRIENKGQVKDGSRWVYAKHPFVRANRERIVRLADDPSAAKKLATKRRPDLGAVFSLVKPAPPRRGAAKTTRLRSRAGARLRIALLVTNPERYGPLQTGVEARYIDEGIKLGGRDHEVDLKAFLAPTFDTLLDALNSYKPQVLHFSGHGGGRALLFDNERAGADGGTVLDYDTVATVLSATTPKPRLLVLAACDTLDGADQFLECVPTVVAMSDSIEDEAACEFSRRFYRSLTAGVSIVNSLKQAKALLKHKGYPDALLPQLIAKDEEARNQEFLT
jgi:predicted transcriptional regulator